MWNDETELAEAVAELHRARRKLFYSERADIDCRVANRGLWRHTLRRRRERVDELERVVAELAARMEAA